jgi:hypothetical protein
MGEIPDLAVVRDYIRVPATVISDDDLERMRVTALTDQIARCTWPGLETPDDTTDDEYPDALAQALLRRVQRIAAAKNLPLGMVGLDAAEYGPQSLPAFDALIAEHEKAFRRQVLA